MDRLIDDCNSRLHLDEKTYEFSSTSQFLSMSNELLDILQPEVELEPDKWFLVPGKAPRFLKQRF